ncbi:MAG: OsmC family protein [Acidobacteriota bacterium]|nr:OsmC family protein [Acidobacteriota bacterium]
MNMSVGFPGGLKVSAQTGGHVVLTDQSERYGGEDAAPPPFDLFLASIATCSGFYALRFCQKRGIETDGLALHLETERDEQERRLARIRILLELPSGFPEKYERAILRAVDQCAVKRALSDPPDLDVAISR